MRSSDSLYFYPAECKFNVQVPPLDGLKASIHTLKAYLFQTVGEVKNKFLESLMPNPVYESYQLVLKGARVDNLKLGEIDFTGCGLKLFHLTRASDAGILIHIQNDNGAYFDARVKPSMTGIERE